jgi:hypothetical protein
MSGLSDGVVALGCGVVAGLALTASGQTVATQTIVTGLTRPVYVTAPRGDYGRLFVVESRFRATSSDPWSGRIRIINLTNNTVGSTPFLSVSGVASTVSGAYITEQGVLGLAFHPDYLNNGYFYIHQTRASDAAVQVVRYRANAPYATATTADPASRTELLTIAHPQTNHNGGWMEFGPDGRLYVAVGDGGNGNDQGTGHIEPGGNAQNLTTLLGKILRLDVDGPDNIPGNADDADPVAGTPYRTDGNPYNGVNGRREIWAYGLRNPWRNNFDVQTGDLWIADVGQDNREEVNVNVGNVGGRNYGWRCTEGTRCTGLTGCTCNGPTLQAPILEYGHSVVVGPTTLLGCSITGGIVYRGCVMPQLRGTYFFTDYCSSTSIYSLRYSGGTVSELADRSAELDPPGSLVFSGISSFGTDADGEMYIVDQPTSTNGRVFKIVPAGGITDCNANQRADGCDLARGTSVDANGNGVPDECDPPACVADMDDGSGTGTPDGGVTIDDLLYYLTVFEAGVIAADVDDGSGTGTPDGGVTIDDLLYYLVRFEAGC